jgi:hypothetical protein
MTADAGVALHVRSMFDNLHVSALPDEVYTPDDSQKELGVETSFTGKGNTTERIG